MSDDKTKTGEAGIERRTLLKALVSVPVLGAFAYNTMEKKARDTAKRRAILSELGVSEGGPAVIPDAVSRPPGRKIRLGIIGCGGEGESLVRHAGFAHPDWIRDARAALDRDPRDKQLEVYLNQADLGVAFTGVCDLFDQRAERGIAASAVDVRPSGAPAQPKARRFRHYTEMLDSGEVDAVIIATPDHWHARICQDAAARGIHVYCEKAMTRTEDEALAVYDAVKRSGIVFQLGHQNRQSESHLKAREVIDAGVLGPISLVEATTNRNSTWGAWVWGIDPKGTPDTIDWAQFQEPSPHKMAFSPERFFRWRCWYDYGTGLAGDLLSHEYDAVNMVLQLGIPHSCAATGGIYYFRDGRDVPDVFHANFEYPERGLTFVYSATLANGYDRGLNVMGHDATMRVSGTLSVTADGESPRYGRKIAQGVIDPAQPMFTYQPGFKGIDAVTSATMQYFASRGLLFTYRGGRRMSAYHLLVQDWLTCIRDGGTPACNIDRAFEEAITCHMATRSYLEGRKVTWDQARRRIV